MNDLTQGELFQIAAHQILTDMDGGFLRATLNDREMWLPSAVVQTMTHCLHIEPGHRILLKVERAQLDWIIDRLGPGSRFIDVGAATGAITLPIATHFEGKVAITAFEPSARNRALLIAAIDRNKFSNITVSPSACADTKGTAPFWELPVDTTGAYPYLPETSTLGSSDDPRARKMEVPVTTLDAQFAGLERGRIAVKIDVEGFESKVLAGAQRFIASQRPAFAIDIHANPFGPGKTDTDVRRLLEPHGYRFEQIAHVLACSPE